RASSSPISMPGWKPSRMPPGCSQGKPSSCEPGAFHSRGSTDPILIVLGCPRERSRLISRARCKICADAQTIVGAFRESVRSFIQKLRNHPESSQRKQRRSKEKRNEYRYQKGNRGRFGNHGRGLSRGHAQL